ncbi:MAG: hypothetical protein RI955_926 [Bacteroidota bacterium]|jgi:PKD repeat protein
MKKLFLLLISFALMQTITKAQIGCNAFLGYYQTPGTTVVTFYDSSNTTSGACIYSNSFIDFGNGTNQHFSMPGSTYTMQYTQGTYHVCIYIQDSVNLSCVDSFCQTITIGNTLPSCVTSFSIWPDSVTAGVYYGANNSTTNGTNPVYTWYWGDGSTSTGAYPTHTYAGSGTYNICLAMTATVGSATCSDSTCLNQVVARMKGGNAIHTISILDPNAPNGINNLVATSKLSVYPNPASSELNIDVKGEKIETIKITAINGQIMNSSFVANKINISNLTPSVYFVEVKTASNIYRTKFIKE